MVTIEALFKNQLNAYDIGVVVHVGIGRLVSTVTERVRRGAVYETDIRPPKRFPKVSVLPVDGDASHANNVFELAYLALLAVVEDRL
jgi:hypothetical protein